MGRAPCCDKANVKKGPWSPDEDAKLKAYIDQYGTGGNWIALPQKIGLKRCGKSCRLRWLNYLRPNLKHGGFSEEEDNIICNLYLSIGSRWSIIAARLPGRTDNDIKNYWNTRLKKKLLGKQRKEQLAWHSSCVKQEMKIESENFMASEAMNTEPYWTALPMAMPLLYDPNLESHIKDQTSLRTFLVKLGGHFSDDHHQQPTTTTTTTNFQYPYDISSSTQGQIYDNFINMNYINSFSQSPNTQFIVNGEGLNMINQELNNFTMEQFDGLESTFSGDMINSRIGNGSAESTSWEDMSNLI